MANPLEKFTAEIKDALQKNNQALAVAKIKEYLKKAANIPLNIGITGESGSGKSSFVNAFRGVDHTDERAAPTGCVETTTEVKPYPHPNYPSVTLWDLPGVGTTKFPADKYLKLVGFEKFDFFIIISDSRFRENDVKLAQEIQKMEKKFYFVRSKIDNDLQAARRSQRDFNEEKTLKQIRENCIQGLEKSDVKSPQVFLLSNFKRHLHDFCHLHETCKRELNKHKRDVLLCTLPKISLEMINKQKEAFKAKIPTYAFLSAAGAAVPIPGLSVVVDGTLLVNAVTEYKVGFGLERPSLQRLADTTGLPLADLTAVIHSPVAKNNINVDTIMKLILQSSTIAALIAAEESLSFIPIFGTMVAATLSYKVTERALENFLDMLAEDAQRVFKKTLGHLNTSL